MSKLFSELGIFGLQESTEDAILCSLLLGTPSLLIGPPGTAKTDCINAVIAALRENSRKKFPNEPEKWVTGVVYDSSKLNFEDLVGLIDVSKLASGNVDFIKTPTTIWGKKIVGFDEFNRCSVDQQSKIFEIIRSRTCMGMKTGTDFIINAMNPYGDMGTTVLSDALVDRHGFFVHFPAYSDLDQDVREMIIKKVGPSDCIGLRAWTGKEFKYDTSEKKVNDSLASIGDSLSRIMVRAGEVFAQLDIELGDRTTDTVDRSIKSVGSMVKPDNPDRFFLLSGRRAAMVRSNIIGFRAVQIAKSEILGTKLQPIEVSVTEAFVMSMPFGISGSSEESISTMMIEKARTEVSFFWRASESNGKSALNNIYELFAGDNLIQKIDILISESLDEMSKNAAWGRVLELDSNRGGFIRAALSALAPLHDGLVPENIMSVLGTDSISAKPSDVIVMTYGVAPIEELVKRYQGNSFLSFLISCSLNSIAGANHSSKRLVDEVTSLSSVCEKIDTKLKAKIEKMKLDTVPQKAESTPQPSQAGYTLEMF